MARRIIKNQEMLVLNRELQFLEEEGVLPEGKAAEIQTLYGVQERQSFTKTLLYVGAILIGAGILSFIASNWVEIGKVAKFALIISMFIGCNVAGYKMEQHYPKTGKSFYYLGAIVFGAGIFLIGQMFHFGGDFQDAFLWWSAGILPLAWVLRDRVILFAAALFAFYYVTNDQFMIGDTIPYWTVIWIPVLYWMNDRLGFSKATAFVTALLPLVLIDSVFQYLNSVGHDADFILGLVYLGIGLAIVLSRKQLKDIYIVLGHLVHSGAALFLSFQNAWPVDWAYIPFSILYLLFVLYLVKRGSLISIVILCVMIFRFYLDLSLDFLPKSFVFIIGGVILLGFGFYFEKQRKKGGGVHE